MRRAAQRLGVELRAHRRSQELALLMRVSSNAGLDSVPFSRDAGTDKSWQIFRARRFAITARIRAPRHLRHQGNEALEFAALRMALKTVYYGDLDARIR
jgi:hypothetical protein